MVQLLACSGEVNVDDRERQVYTAACTSEGSIRFLAIHQLLKNAMPCPLCPGVCAIASDATLKDGIIWRCGQCKRKVSIRRGSLFHETRVPLGKVMIFIYCWSRNWPLKHANEESGGMSNQTQTDWANFLRDVCADYVMANPRRVGGWTLGANGGLVPKTVEIDETFFFHRKYHRGRYHGGQWVFGGVERGRGGRCFLVPVADRRRQTLEPIILHFIAPGTKIISDGWASYHNIGRIWGGMYFHQVINHNAHFVDPDDRDIHTNSVENL
eukprot:snap_masked-scaffold3356_size9073-processed-gene-0.4 protein:Tk06377 transcript:snap_masked-scaffold3356_size9073-processed-gene-0.4-mRNA-1 annotation:"hypothetical protein TcasGA2_TC003734"